MGHYTATSPGRQYGFTLIELVVTITLLGIVLASAALLGRYATEPIRSLSEATNRAREINFSSYLSRQLDDIAVVISWSDSTLIYLNECGTPKAIDLTVLRRAAYREQTIAWFEATSTGHFMDQEQDPLNMAFFVTYRINPEIIQIRLCLVTGRAYSDTTQLVRNIHQQSIQR